MRKKQPIVLEVSLVNQPSFVLVVGEVTSAPETGDFVSHIGKRDLFGYVAPGRRWEIDGDGLVVRVWLQKDPPR